MNFKVWLKAIRLPFSTATIIPVSLGSIIAWHDTGSFIWARFGLTLLGAWLIHTGTNLANDYYDYTSGCDVVNKNPTPFSGGSRVIPEGLIPPKKILFASLISFAIGGSIGLYLNYVSGSNIILMLGFLGIFLGFFYTANPLRIGYGTFGEAAVGLGFGPLMVMGAYYVQAKALPLSALLSSIPVGILIALVLFINEFPDYAADKTVNKRTLVVVLGKARAVILYHLLLALTYLSIISFAVFGLIPVFCLAAFLTLPLAYKAFKVSKNNFDKIQELLPANAFTIGLHLMVGLLLCAGFVLDKFLTKA